MMSSWKLRDVHEALEEELTNTAISNADFTALMFVKRLIADKVLRAEAMERAEYEAKRKAEEEKA